MNEVVRTAVAIAALILTVGGGVLKMANDVSTLQSQVASLTTTVNAIYCNLQPDAFTCRH